MGSLVPINVRYHILSPLRVLKRQSSCGSCHVTATAPSGKVQSGPPAPRGSASMSRKLSRARRIAPPFEQRYPGQRSSHNRRSSSSPCCSSCRARLLFDSSFFVLQGAALFEHARLNPVRRKFAIARAKRLQNAAATFDPRAYPPARPFQRGLVFSPARQDDLLAIALC
jgi:hypothetical protein